MSTPYDRPRTARRRARACAMGRGRGAQYVHQHTVAMGGGAMFMPASLFSVKNREWNVQGCMAMIAPPVASAQPAGKGTPRRREPRLRGALQPVVSARGRHKGVRVSLAHPVFHTKCDGH